MRILQDHTPAGQLPTPRARKVSSIAPTEGYCAELIGTDVFVGASRSVCLSLSGGVCGQFMSTGPRGTVILRLVPGPSLPSRNPESGRQVADRLQDTQTGESWGPGPNGAFFPAPVSRSGDCSPSLWCGCKERRLWNQRNQGLSPGSSSFCAGSQWASCLPCLSLRVPICVMGRRHLLNSSHPICVMGRRRPAPTGLSLPRAKLPTWERGLSEGVWGHRAGDLG